VEELWHDILIQFASCAGAKGRKLFLKGERCLSPKCAIERRAFPPGMHGKKQTFRRKTSDYGLQLLKTKGPPHLRGA
jgi:hypothetical protein